MPFWCVGLTFLNVTRLALLKQIAIWFTYSAKIYFLSFSRLEKAILVTLFSWYFHNRLAPLKVNSWINCAQRDQIGFFNVNKVLIYYIIPLKDLYCLFLTFLSELPDWLFWGQQLNKFGVWFILICFLV